MNENANYDEDEEFYDEDEEFVTGQKPPYYDPYEVLEERLEHAFDDYKTGFECFWRFGSPMSVKARPEDADKLPVDWQTWQDLYEWHLKAKNVAAVARLLVEHHCGDFRIDEDLFEQGKQDFHDWYRWRVLELINSEVGPKPDESLAGPMGRYLVYSITLQLEAARLFPYSYAVFAERLHKLTQYVVRNPTQRCASYLARVSRCYVLGLNTELAVMARSAVDAALEDLVDNDTVSGKVGGGDRVNLVKRIEYCRAAGVFDDKVYTAAQQIKRSGNDAVHIVPQQAPDPDDTMEHLLAVLKCLDDFTTRP